MASGRERFSIISDGLPTQLPDIDPNETGEWLESLDAGLLSGPAREALDRGDTSDEALLTALRGVLQAEVQRGG